MGFRDFKRVRDTLEKNVHLDVVDDAVDVRHQRFTYDVDVKGVPRRDGCTYILDHWNDDWFPTDYLAIRRLGPGTYRLYIGDGYSFPVTECEEIRPPRDASTTT